MKRQQNEYEKSKALLKENRHSKAPSTAAQPVMSTFASAKSSPIKRFNANLLSNPHPLNSNTTPITSSSSQVKHTSETAHTELEQIKSEPKRKRRRLT